MKRRSLLNRPLLRPALRVELMLSLLVVLPVLAAAVRALVDGWIPMGENAIMPLRARDVLTADHPFLGTFSSASLTSDTIVNHPGPLLFDLLAIPVRLFGSAAGTVLGIAVINLVSLGVALRAAFAAGGRGLFVAAAIGAAALEWTLGSSLLIDPWNPHVLVLAWYATMLAAIGLACGWRPGLAWVVALGSFAIQTHVSYALQVPLLLAAAIGLGALGRRSVAGTEGRPVAPVAEHLRSWRRHGALALGVGFLLWAQPLWQQVAGAGPGNLTALLRTAREDQARAGWGVAVRLVAQVVALPPLWWRRSFTDSLQDLPLRGADGGLLPMASWVPSAGAAVAGLAVVVVLLAGAIVVGRRTGRWSVLATAAVALVAVAIGTWSASSIPAGGYGVAPHQLRWLWPISVLWMVAVGHGAVALVAGRRAATSSAGAPEAPAGPDTASGEHVRPAMPVVVAGLAVAALVLHACVGYDQPVGVARAPGSRESVEAITAQVAAASFPEAILDNAGLWIGEPYTAPILERLYRDDRPIVVDEVQAAQVGRRRLAGDDVDSRMYLRAGAAALICPSDGSVRIALTSSLPDTTVEVVTRGAIDVRRVLDTVLLVADAASLAEAPDVEAAADDVAARTDLVTSGRFAEVLRSTALGTWVSEEDRALVEAFETARAAVGIETVAVFVGPRDPDVPWAHAAEVVAGRPDAACPSLDIDATG